MNLNIGCGRLRLAGYVGVDAVEWPTVDRVVDLSRIPWPFESDSADRIVAWHVLEHLPGYDFHRAMSELHRILRPGGTLYVKVPYREHPIFDPHHFRSFARHTFNSWIDRPGFGLSTSLQRYRYFRRLRQEVVRIPAGRFPGWHVAHHLPRLNRLLFPREDERTRWTWVPIPGADKELREWLVKIG